MVREKKEQQIIYHLYQFTTPRVQYLKVTTPQVLHSSFPNRKKKKLFPS